MTPQNVMIANIEEIPALDIVCKCGSRISIPLPMRNTNLQPFIECIGCNARLWDADHEQGYLRTLALLRSLSQWHELQSKKFAIEFSIKQSVSQK